jgi:hypothetical protein
VQKLQAKSSKEQEKYSTIDDELENIYADTFRKHTQETRAARLNRITKVVADAMPDAVPESSQRAPKPTDDTETEWIRRKMAKEKEEQQRTARDRAVIANALKYNPDSSTVDTPAKVINILRNDLGVKVSDKYRDEIVRRMNNADNAAQKGSEIIKFELAGQALAKERGYQVSHPKPEGTLPEDPVKHQRYKFMLNSGSFSGENARKHDVYRAGDISGVHAAVIQGENGRFIPVYRNDIRDADGKVHAIFTPKGRKAFKMREEGQVQDTVAVPLNDGSGKSEMKPVYLMPDPDDPTKRRETTDPSAPGAEPKMVEVPGKDKAEVTLHYPNTRSEKLPDGSYTPKEPVYELDGKGEKIPLYNWEGDLFIRNGKQMYKTEPAQVSFRDSQDNKIMVRGQDGELEPYKQPFKIPVDFKSLDDAKGRVDEYMHKHYRDKAEQVFMGDELKNAYFKVPAIATPEQGRGQETGVDITDW